jgi:hypothetical protein
VPCYTVAYMWAAAAVTALHSTFACAYSCEDIADNTPEQCTNTEYMQQLHERAASIRKWKVVKARSPLAKVRARMHNMCMGARCKVSITFL